MCVCVQEWVRVSGICDICYTVKSLVIYEVYIHIQKHINTHTHTLSNGQQQAQSPILFVVGLTMM